MRRRRPPACSPPGAGWCCGRTTGPHCTARAASSTCSSSPDELFRRLRHDTRRPLLQVRNPLARLRELHVQRDPLYRETAHFVIETGRPSVHTLVNMILMQLELAGLVPSDAAPSPVGPERARDPR